MTTGSTSGAATGTNDGGSTLDSSLLESGLPPDAGYTVPRSAGCGKPWTGATGQWVSQPPGCAQGTENQGTDACQTIPPGGVVPALATQGSPEHRGWWVMLPMNYDATKAYPVIYAMAGDGDGNWFHAGVDGYPFQSVDDNGAILVGLDYDTFSTVPGCYDSLDPRSNDVLFFPWLMNQIESQFCVDIGAEFITGYDCASGGGAVPQLNCVSGGKLRGGLDVQGQEPGARGGLSGGLPTCNPAPSAMLFVHDFNNTDCTYNAVLPACARVLAQNGCSNTKCDPMDPTLTTPYVAPAGVTLALASGTCVQFNGCPADYPVVFCTTNYVPNHDDDGTRWGVVPLAWDFFQRLGSKPPR